MNLMPFLADSIPAVHVAPSTDLTVFGWNITDAMILGWAITLLSFLILVVVAKRVSVKPKGGIVQYVEAIVTFISNLVENAFTDKKIGRKYVPFFVTLFFFTLINNLSELIPGVGNSVLIHGHPLLRPITADLNMTLAMGAVTMIMVYAASIKEFGGLRKYVRHFFIGSPLNPLYLTIGIIEMLTDLTRLLSLAVRLFLNITIGEIVIDIFGYLGGLLAPANVLAPVAALPFTLLEVGVCALQAYIFVILGVNYLAIAANAAHSHDSLTEDDSSETIGASVPEGAKG